MGLLQAAGTSVSPYETAALAKKIANFPSFEIADALIKLTPKGESGMVSAARFNANEVDNRRAALADSDYAKESADLAKYQILTQAGSSMLAKANKAPSQALQLQ